MVPTGMEIKTQLQGVRVPSGDKLSLNNKLCARTMDIVRQKFLQYFSGQFSLLILKVDFIGLVIMGLIKPRMSS